MFRVKEEHLHNEHVRRMFYDIPRVGNMIAARQLDFLGKTMRGPHDRPAQQMMTAWCDNVRRVGRPFLHNKDFIVKNLRLLFVNVPEVTIDDYGSLKNWINEALDKKYWNDLLDCLTDCQASIPERPAELPRPRRSPRNHDARDQDLVRQAASGKVGAYQAAAAAESTTFSPHSTANSTHKSLGGTKLTRSST